jgi:hypothetical protein
MNMTLTLDPTDRRERDLAMEMLRALGEGSSNRPPKATAAKSRSVESKSVTEICRELLDADEYGRTRLQIVRAIAEASPKPSPREAVYGVAEEISPDKDPGRVVGGLHKSLETSWKRLGGPGVFFRTQRTGFVMDSDVAKAVLGVLGSKEDEGQ